MSDDESYGSNDFTNPEFLSAILQDSPRTKARKAPRCPLCHKAFAHKRSLKRHSKKCRLLGSQRVINCGATGWTCSICHSAGDHPKEFKEHIFHEHGDRDVQEYYQRAWAELLNPTCLSRLRTEQLTSIRLGHIWRRF